MEAGIVPQLRGGNRGVLFCRVHDHQPRGGLRRGVDVCWLVYHSY